MSGGSESRYGYEGKEHDSFVGDTDFNFRKYKPDWGMFIQPDTLIQNVYDPQSLNRYSFERGNPYKYVDPSGHQRGVQGMSYNQYMNSLPPVPVAGAAGVGNRDWRNYPDAFYHSSVEVPENLGKFNDADMSKTYISQQDSEHYDSDPYFKESCGTCTNYFRPNPLTQTSTKYMGLEMHASSSMYVLPPILSGSNSIFTLKITEGMGVAVYTKSGRQRKGISGSYTSSSGHSIDISVNTNNEGGVVGGSLGDFQMSEGFARKLKEALESIGDEN